MRTYYAQNREDLLIESYFPDVEKGFYVDVGANDPVIDSVTKHFYDQGWHGINIEPIARYASALKQQRVRDATLQIGVAGKAGELKFREYPEGDGLSTFENGMKKYYETEAHDPHAEKFKEYTVPVKPLRDILAEQKVRHIHFMKIDVEGFEHDVLEGNDWKKFRPELICIEANHVGRDWHDILKGNGYEKVFFDGINEYFLAAESLHRREYFNYPDAVFAGWPVYFRAREAIGEDIRWQLKEQHHKEHQTLKRLLEDKERTIFQLEDQNHNLRFLLKRLIKEVRIRIERRAAGAPTGQSLYYRSDPALRAFVDSAPSADDLLAFVHDRDQQNIYKNSGQSLKNTLKLAFWRTVAAVLKAGYFSAKAIVKLLRRK